MKAKVLIVIATLLAVSAATADDNGIAWDSLTEEQQQVLGPYIESWDSLAPQRQQRLSTGADR